MTSKKILSYSLIGGVLLLIWQKLFGGSSRPSPAKSPTITASNVKTAIAAQLTAKGYSARFANNWFLVANMETAGFSSRLFTDYFNPWGMKQPRIRKTTSIGPVVLNGQAWAAYRDVPEAVRDLIFYLEEFRYPMDFLSLDDQLKFMKVKGYFEDSLERYRDLVTAWANKYGYSYA